MEAMVKIDHGANYKVFIRAAVARSEGETTL